MDIRGPKTLFSDRVPQRMPDKETRLRQRVTGRELRPRGDSRRREAFVAFNEARYSVPSRFAFGDLFEGAQ